MQSPAAMFIESALDGLKDVPEWLRKSQLAELHEAMGETDSAFDKGYELGLQTARVVIKGDVVIGLSGINPEDVL